MRPLIATLLAATLLASPVHAGTAELINAPSKLAPEWQKQTRELFKQVVEIPTVKDRNEVPRMANLLADRLKAAGIPASDISIIPYEATKGDQTVMMIARWRSPKPTKKPMLILGHMDVVEAKRSDWERDPFQFIEEGGYFYGRGTSDMKNGIVATTMAVLKLKAAGFKPNRDIILFFSGDEETAGQGATLGADKYRSLTDAEFGLNADGGAGGYTHDGKPLGFAVSTAEKTYQSYTLTAHNPGGHSSRPRPDNAIYDLADALKAVQAYRFTPRLNETSRAYFAKRAQDEGDSALGKAIRAWLANANDGAAADAVEASELEVGRTRTRCVATMLNGGHADNALPQTAQAVVNCRIIPGEEPAGTLALLKQIVGPKIEVAYYEDFIGVPSPPSPLRADVLGAVKKAVNTVYGPTMDVFPIMATGASDGSFFRSKGIPVYDIDGSWGIIPDDERAHGLNERIPVRAMYDDVVYWESVISDLAAKKKK
ncbi:M20/M25/M40 family metallo-hydrolase [Sphingomonas jaspsi]|uniref:M20/M25/M40 family metallo-hydrolase n=1 Tax=Sphingomonas jaspsi TaxID=392409 RepID=UPI0004B60C55|nr:M20/M25/M40 family metallo-hydrolase [Sphingomonas jaspsi]